MSIYVGPWALPQMTADTPAELLHAGERLGVPVDEVCVRLCIKTRALAVNMGAIELSRREFVKKLDEIGRFGRGSGPKLAQIQR